MQTRPKTLRWSHSIIIFFRREKVAFPRFFVPSSWCTFVSQSIRSTLILRPTHSSILASDDQSFWLFKWFKTQLSIGRLNLFLNSLILNLPRSWIHHFVKKMHKMADIYLVICSFNNGWLNFDHACSVCVAMFCTNNIIHL